MVRFQKPMMVLFIDGAASRKANSNPVVDTSTSAMVMIMYGTVCQSTLSFSPASMRVCIIATMTNENPAMNMPQDMRLNGVARRPSAGYTSQVNIGTKIITRMGFADSI